MTACLSGKHLANLGQTVGRVVAESYPGLAKYDAWLYRDEDPERTIRPGQGMKQIDTYLARGTHEGDHHLAGLNDIGEETVLVR